MIGRFAAQPGWVLLPRQWARDRFVIRHCLLPAAMNECTSSDFSQAKILRSDSPNFVRGVYFVSLRTREMSGIREGGFIRPFPFESV